MPLRSFPLRGMGMTTIKDVAARAAVSTGTVSNVLAGRRVRPEIVERVREAMIELDYSPNGIARSLRGQRTQTIGLVVPDNANPFFAELSWAIEQACVDSGFALMLCNTGRALGREATAIELLLEKRVDGIIVATSDNPRALEQVIAARVPLIMVDYDASGLTADAVLVDHRRGGELAARHLMALGHQRIACIVGLPARANATRIQGFRHALSEGGLELPAHRIYESDTHAEGGYCATRTLLQRDPDITAIFTANDLVALGAIRASFDLGRPVPGTLSLVGYDDIAIADQVMPRLTTIRQPLAEIGRRAIEVLRHRISEPDGPVERWVLPVELVERESTASVNALAGWTPR
jgi:LacI family transcriptional regulator